MPRVTRAQAQCAAQPGQPTPVVGGVESPSGPNLEFLRTCLRAPTRSSSSNKPCRLDDGADRAPSPSSIPYPCALHLLRSGRCSRARLGSVGGGVRRIACSYPRGSAGRGCAPIMRYQAHATYPKDSFSLHQSRTRPELSLARQIGARASESSPSARSRASPPAAPAPRAATSSPRRRRGFGDPIVAADSHSLLDRGGSQHL